jgi:hypothetical protein
LRLEQLETRDCPSTLIDGPVNVSDPLTNVGQVSLPAVPAAPAITLSVTLNCQRSVTLSGTVTADNPAGLTVTLTGVVTATTTTDNTGRFSLTTDATSLGDVQATTVDAIGQTSDTAVVTISCPPPEISNFTWLSKAGYVTLTGTVSSADQMGMTVTIQGALINLQNPQTAIAGSDGSFSLSVRRPRGDMGTVTATCVDCWGQQSIVAYTFVS